MAPFCDRVIILGGQRSYHGHAAKRPLCHLRRAIRLWREPKDQLGRVIGSSSEPLTWSQLASLGNDLGGITWREYEEPGERRLGPGMSRAWLPLHFPANGKKSKKTAGTEDGASTCTLGVR